MIIKSVVARLRAFPLKKYTAVDFWYLLGNLAERYHKRLIAVLELVPLKVWISTPTNKNLGTSSRRAASPFLMEVPSPGKLSPVTTRKV